MSKQNKADTYCYNEEKVTRIKKELTNEDMKEVVQLFRILADERRANIIFVLCQDDELCVGDIANIIDSSVATTSHHIRTLLKQGVVKYRKEGKLAFYSMQNEMVKALMMIVLGHGKAVKLSGN